MATCYSMLLFLCLPAVYASNTSTVQQWLTDEGALLAQNVDIQPRASVRTQGLWSPAGWKFTATSPIAKDQPILTVAQSHVLTFAKVTQDNTFAFLVPSLRSAIPNGSPIYLTAIYLLQEKSKGKESQWAPWIESLPKEVDNLYFWGDADLEALEGTQAGTSWKNRREKIKNDWALVRGALNMLQQNQQGEFKLTSITYEEFLWALAHVFSRSFWWTYEGERYPVLVPLADLVDNSPAGHDWRITEQSDLEIFAAKDVKKGQAIGLNHNLECNLDMLMDRGTVVRMPQHDCLKMTLEPKGDQSKLRTKLMKDAGFSSLSEFMLRNKKTVPAALLKFQRIAMLDEKLLSNESNQQLLLAGNPMDDTFELEVLESLQRLVQRLLTSYEDIDYEEDEIVLSTRAPKASWRKLMAVVVRHGEMKVIETTLHTLQKMARDTTMRLEKSKNKTEL